MHVNIHVLMTDIIQIKYYKIGLLIKLRNSGNEVPSFATVGVCACRTRWFDDHDDFVFALLCSCLPGLLCITQGGIHLK